MSNDGWTIEIDADGTWLCEHSNSQGNATPPTRLTANEATIENPQDSPERQRGLSSDCDTYWRVWKGLKQAKQYVLSPLVDFIPPPGRYRRLRQRDIDQILAALKESFSRIEAAHNINNPGPPTMIVFGPYSPSHRCGIVPN